MGIQFAPLRVPLERRLQTFAVCAAFVVLILFGMTPIALPIFAYVTLFTQYYWLAVIYAAFWYGERNIAKTGGRPSHWVRNWSWWRYCANYFPIKLLKTVDLDPSKNYLFCVFPHAITSGGPVIAFASEALGVSKLLPGLTTSLTSIVQNFSRPLTRDLILSMGFCDSSKESLSYRLSKPGGGNAAVLIVGGAAEALKSKPRTYSIVLKERKGFVKIALQNGASLVPVVSFGEVDVYDQMEGPWLLWAQNIIRKWTGVAPVMLLGRGIFQYSFGLMPRRAPITIVIGKPIHVEQVVEPTGVQIDFLHQKFTESLISLFEAEKHKHVENADDVTLEIN